MLQTNPKQQIFMLVTLSLLFGLGWGIGLAATNSFPVQWLRYSFQIIFVVLVSLQGLFFFLVYGVRLLKIRRVWLKWMYIITNQHSKAVLVDSNIRGTNSASLRMKQCKQDSYKLSDNFGKNDHKLIKGEEDKDTSFRSSSSPTSITYDQNPNEPITDSTIHQSLCDSTATTTYNNATQQNIAPVDQATLSNDNINTNQIKGPLSPEYSTIKNSMEVQPKSTNSHIPLEQTISINSELVIEQV